MVIADNNIVEEKIKNPPFNIEREVFETTSNFPMFRTLPQHWQGPGSLYFYCYLQKRNQEHTNQH